MIIDQTEMEDFRTALKQQGCHEDEFELSSKQDPMPAGRVSPVTGSVTVKNTKTGREQTYKAGYGTSWVVEFESDLKVGKFS